MDRKIDIAVYVALILGIVLTLGFIFGNSLKGPAESMEQSNTVVEIIRPIIDPHGKMSDDEISHLVRKSGHFIEYMILGGECALLAYYVKRRLTLAGAVCAAGGCLLSADIDEYIQSFTGRGSMVSDVLLDFLGAVTGIAIGFAVSILPQSMTAIARQTYLVRFAVR